jgi:hypothetical protein
VGQAGLDLAVMDPAGAPVGNADVTLTEPSRKQTVRGKTDKHGRFVLAGARTGQYLITISAHGLVSFPETVDLRGGEKLSLSMKLTMGLLGDIAVIEPGSKPSRDSVPINVAPLPLSGAVPRPMQR